MPWPLPALSTKKAVEPRLAVPEYGRENPPEPAFCQTSREPSVARTCPLVPPEAASLPFVTPPLAMASGDEGVPSPAREVSWETVEIPLPEPKRESANCISKVVASLERLATPEPTAMILPAPARTATSRVMLVELTEGRRS